MRRVLDRNRNRAPTAFDDMPAFVDAYCSQCGVVARGHLYIELRHPICERVVVVHCRHCRAVTWHQLLDYVAPELVAVIPP